MTGLSSSSQQSRQLSNIYGNSPSLVCGGPALTLPLAAPAAWPRSLRCAEPHRTSAPWRCWLVQASLERRRKRGLGQWRPAPCSHPVSARPCHGGGKRRDVMGASLIGSPRKPSIAAWGHAPQRVSRSLASISRSSMLRGPSAVKISMVLHNLGNLLPVSSLVTLPGSRSRRS